MAGLFDVAKELARLNKQRTKLQKVRSYPIVQRMLERATGVP